MLQYTFVTVDITSRIKCSVLLHKTSEELRQWPLEWTLRKSMVTICAICCLAVVLVCDQTSLLKSLHQCLCFMTFNMCSLLGSSFLAVITVVLCQLLTLTSVHCTSRCPQEE